MRTRFHDHAVQSSVAGEFTVFLNIDHGHCKTVGCCSCMHKTLLVASMAVSAPAASFAKSYLDRSDSQKSACEGGSHERK